ncbi:hypothetical protein C8J56DRAFT_1157342 [Mycena floridula]|nr:hypothetical protein C8J56DRAFT_1157342 [Mycena floridula]
MESFRILLVLFFNLESRLSTHEACYTGRKPILYASIGCFLDLLYVAQLRIASGSWYAVPFKESVVAVLYSWSISLLATGIVPLNERDKYGGLVGSIWGIASVVGPLLGGVSLCGSCLDRFANLASTLLLIMYPGDGAFT